MAIIAAVEAERKFGELLDRVQGGEEIVITRHEQPVARLIPEAARSLEEVRRAAEGLLALQNEIARSAAGQRSIPWDEFKACVEEGRR